MKKPLFLGVGLAAWVLAGCGSAPSIAYYTLSQPEGQATAAPPSKGVGFYTIAPVTVPAVVDDTPIIVRQSTDRLMVLNYDRWTAPLSDQIRNALSQSLTAQLGMPPVQNLQTGGGEGLAPIRVTVDVQRFDLVPGQLASLGAVWRVDWVKPVRSLTCYSTMREPAQPGVVALVSAQQTNVQRLASQLADTIRSGKAPAGLNCQ